MKRWFSLVFRLHLWRRKARYWKTRARQLELQLRAERYRNMSREDELISVPMRAMGMFGMPPRDCPAQMPPAAKLQTPLTAVADPFQALNALQKQEWELEWWPDAQAAGITEKQAREDFLRHITQLYNNGISDGSLM